MERKMYKKLQSWKNSSHRRPMLLQGARQVGKTYSALDFGKKEFANTIYLNFEGSPYLKNIFSTDLNPHRIIEAISAFTGQSILPEKTLLIFDEIQACEEALTSLKYFCEEAPEYCIIAAGSLLGVAINREKYSFPVGKVDMLTMYPLDFEEFLIANNAPKVASMIREYAGTCQPFPLHEHALDYYQNYLIVGGMPQVVKEYVETKDFNRVMACQYTLNDSYIADMAKYATPQDTAKTLAVWQCLPAQLAKENQKFQYKLIKSGARAHQYELSIDWLRSAGMIHKCYLTREGFLPLCAYTDNSSFKIYMVDTGLLCSKFRIPANIIKNSPHGFDGFKGALVENYIMQALCANGLEPYYWTSPGKAELDFLFQDAKGNIIPVEVKSADHVRSKSLHTFCKKYPVPYAYRISTRNFGFENNIKSYPLYAAFTIS